MIQTQTNLHSLATQASEGNIGALATFRRELEPSLERVVRRALRARPGASALTRRIQAAASTMTPAGVKGSASALGRMASRVSHQLCSSLCGQIGAGNAPTNWLRETVRD